MADISKIKVGSTTYEINDSYARTAIICGPLAFTTTASYISTLDITFPAPAPFSSTPYVITQFCNGNAGLNSSTEWGSSYDSITGGNQATAIHIGGLNVLVSNVSTTGFTAVLSNQLISRGRTVNYYYAAIGNLNSIRG